MRWSRLGVVVAAAGVWVGGVAQAQETGPGPSVESGRKVYVSYCARCHGVNMVNNGATFDLRQFPVDQQERFERSVNQGLRAMPAWGGILKPGDVQALWAYVKVDR